MIRHYISTLLGKTVRTAARLRGGGSALPGLVIEKIDPRFLVRTLEQLPHGVVLISGTNGKTTTTKMVVQLLEGQGLRVFTNRTGSNFTRGVVAALLGEVDIHGKLEADIAVLELDEAHAVHFVQTVSPRYSLLLNVMRDQLDRFGEIDTTATLLHTIAQKTTEGVMLNREDPRVRAIGQKLSNKEVAYFGLDPALTSLFPDDDSLHGASAKTQKLPEANVTLAAISESGATFAFDNAKHTTQLRLRGIYNVYNAAAAIAFVRQICKSATDTTALMSTLSEIEPAFGRGETITVNNQPLELVLVKNPSGFRLGLSSFPPDGYETMIAINDNYADGRDMSWLWDINFESLRDNGVAMVSGIRAYDMALRLQYDLVIPADIQLDLKKAVHEFISTHPNTPKRIYCTYTAMLALRRELGSITKVRGIDR